MTNKKLSALRQAIDEVDDQLLKLLLERADLAIETREHKKKEKLQTTDGVYDPVREQAVLDRVLESPHEPLSDMALQHVFQTIMGECRSLQHANQGAVVVSIQGDRGSFSEQAANLFATKHLRCDYQLRYDLTPNGVVESLLSREADFGIMAVNNAWGGLVEDSIEALACRRYRIIDMMPMPVLQCLLTRPTQDPSKITRIVSHRQALLQCRQYLDTHYPDAERIEYDDTALAARDCAASKLGDGTAVIASQSCEKKYGLVVIHRAIQYLNDNDTLFVAISRYKQTD